jgi:hypothetical protein
MLEMNCKSAESMDNLAAFYAVLNSSWLQTAARNLTEVKLHPQHHQNKHEH